ncbi:CheY-like chemotaxis protein [Oxalobacteraceae bacterium GrIS 1.11]
MTAPQLAPPLAYQIAPTANAMPRDVEGGIALGFFRHLTKPINIEEFTEAINSTLAHVADRPT